MPADYEVDATRQTHIVGADGNLKDVVEISFHTVPEEATGEVRVPLSAGWEQAAVPLIEKRVAELRALYAP